MKIQDKFLTRALLVLSIIMAVFIYQEVSRFQLVFWDEGYSLWQTYIVRQAFLNGFLGDFWEASRQQILSPFLQSWYLALMSLFLGFSEASLRMISLLLFVPATLLMWKISRFTIKGRLFFQLLPVLLFITSPTIVYFYSTVMKEGLGVVLTLLAFYLYFLAQEKRSVFLALLTGLSTLMLFLTKYNYAALMVIPLGIGAIRLGLKFWSWLFAPLFLGVIWWVLVSHNILSEVWQVLQNDYAQNLTETDLLGHLLFYPQEVVYSYLLSPWMGVLAAIGFCWSLKEWRSPFVRVLATFFLLNLSLAVFHINNNQARYIFTAIPALFLLTGIGLNSMIKGLNSRLHLKVVILILVLAGISLNGFWTKVRSAGSHQSGSALFYESDYSPNFRFDFNTSRWPHQLPPGRVPEETINNVFKFIFSETDISGSYILVDEVNEFGSPLLNLKLVLERKAKGVSFSGGKIYYIVSEIEPGGRLDTSDYRLHYPKEEIAGVLSDKSLIQVSEKTFPFLGMTIKILQKI